MAHLVHYYSASNVDLNEQPAERFNFVLYKHVESSLHSQDMVTFASVYLLENISCHSLKSMWAYLMSESKPKLIYLKTTIIYYCLGQCFLHILTCIHTYSFLPEYRVHFQVTKTSLMHQLI